ncbi:virulence factor SrfB [Buttiauxella warmboldiae]|uniref:Virulence factor SrfB n=1 Tax=Buttiauxella warmboldiae TaxID=82993 RepID=A0A3N5EDU4_9ENTR|nr:virulence factor SrfB [Buttiauxella warmboldiae]RPH29242.1 virulence factor SrfB [Buttiauxella warmboldiae]
MLINLINYNANIALIQNSSIQFLDFGLNPITKNPHSGRFVRHSVNGPLLRLQHDRLTGRFILPGENGEEPEILKPESIILLEHSLDVMDKVWLPLPFMRTDASRSTMNTPLNWARVQLKRLQTPDTAGNTLRICIAFDTKIHADDSGAAPLALTSRDVLDGTRFALAWHDHEVSEFLDQTWVDGWLREVFTHYATHQEGRSCYEVNAALKAFEYQAHFLNILEMLGSQLSVPQVQIVAETLNTPSVPVDLILDIGNTHTCGIILEDHGKDNAGLQQSAELQIRSLSEPQRIGSPLFTSRLEFSEAKFGKPHFSMESGRKDAFVWPSFARVGDEARQLATQRYGTEGNSGISSPRRYLCDDTPSQQAWRFSQLTGKNQREPRAIALPLMNLINDDGQPLDSLPSEERLPVFSPNYSPSSLMTIMMCELLAQALTQINSAAHRESMGRAMAPRQLRQLILTLPSAIPKQEREILRLRAQEAIKLVWKALEWQAKDEENSPFLCVTDRDRFGVVPLPDVQMEWDEATCGQLVWLYNEVINNYSGQAQLCFQSLTRPDRKIEANERAGGTLRVASIDIGGGTTDMAITQYRLDDGTENQFKINPQLLFREGFKVAGDDILLDVIQYSVLPALQLALEKAGVSAAERVMSELFGDVDPDGSRAILRQQSTLQLFIPLGHAILAAWESCDPQDDCALFAGRFGELLTHTPTANVINYIEQTVQSLQPDGTPAFKVLDVPLLVELATLKEALLSGKFSLTAPLQALSEAIGHYCCDVLLVTGRPSCLPGVQALLRYLQPVPMKRIIWLDNYQIHEHFPFGYQGRVVNPKSTAALGAMLCRLATDLRLPGFSFNAADIQAYSTIRYLGMLDSNHKLPEANVWYSDIDLDNPAAQLPETLNFSVKNDICLGFRQLADARWPATALYGLKINTPELSRSLSGNGVLHVSLQYEPRHNGFTLAQVRMEDGTPVPAGAVQLKLNTLPQGKNDTHQYWIDSGSVYLK